MPPARFDPWRRAVRVWQRHWCCVPSALLLVLSLALPAQANLEAFARNCSSATLPPEKAVRFCTKALQTQRLGPKGTAQTLLNRGRSLKATGQSEAALADFEAALRSYPNLGAAWTDRGLILSDQGRHEEAVASFDNALLVDPEDWRALVGRGAARTAVGQHDAALSDLDQAVEAEPERAFGYLIRARAHAAAGRKLDAMRDFDEATRLSPNDPAPLLGRAALREADAPNAALRDYTAALELSPDLAFAHYRRGRVFDGLGHTALANRDLRRAWRLGYRDVWLHNRMVSLGD
ncbi:MAG: tetratricopeptide repeat protein [Pseudomonadota bacterium]